MDSILDYAYDVAGNRTELKWDPSANGLIVRNTYDALNRLATLSRKVPTIGVQTGTAAIGTYSYDDLSRRSTLTLANGTSTTYAYDTQSMPASLSLNVAGTALDAAFSFTRNQIGDITQNAPRNLSFQWRGYRNELVITCVMA